MSADGDGAVVLYDGNLVTTDKPNKNPAQNSFSIKVGLAQLLRGGVIFEVSTPRHAKIAESAGACCISLAGDLGRMTSPTLLKEIKRSVSIPVIAKSRAGHFVEAQILESLGADYIDENELLSLADDQHFINKHNFRVPFICGAHDLGDALRRVREGAAMVRTQGDLSGSGDIAKTVDNVRAVMGSVRMLSNMDEDEVFAYAKKIGAPYELVVQTKQMGRLPVVHFASGGIVTPADVALMMQLGCDGVFVGPDVFDGPDPYRGARGIVEAVRNYNDPGVLAGASCSGLSEAMAGLDIDDHRVVEL